MRRAIQLSPIETPGWHDRVIGAEERNQPLGHASLPNTAKQSNIALIDTAMLFFRLPSRPS
jgi:hypothetical protein